MKIPQLIQEIIDYYIYLVPWKARIKQLNEEYNEHYYYLNGMLACKKYGFTYNWRIIGGYCIYHPHNKTVTHVAQLPSRYFFSNTQEQLKSL